MTDRPHILILMPDQMRADCLSCADHPVIQTPSMVRLAAEGVRFPNAYTSSPVCMPARSSFLSGLYCHNHGQWGNYGHLPADADTFAKRLVAEGYHSCHVGKSHYYSHVAGEHLKDHEPFMNALGWQDVLEVTGPHATHRTDSIMTDHWQQIGALDTFRNDYARRGEAGPFAATWPSPMPPGESQDDFVGRTAVEYVQGYDDDKPLCLFVGFGGPHEPWDPPPDWAAKYAPDDMDAPLPSNEPGPWVPEAAAAYQRKLETPREGMTAQAVGRIRTLYYAKISHIDWWFGRIFDALEQRGMLANTAVVFWSDHGEMLCDHGRLYKSVFYDPAARIPMMVRTPDKSGAGTVNDALVSLVDVFPTILELAGCEPKENAFGKSLVPLTADASAPYHDAVFSEINDQTMIRDRRWKMVVSNEGEVRSLYDMQDDPFETVNLLGKAEAAGVFSELGERLLKWHLATPSRRK